MVSTVPPKSMQPQRPPTSKTKTRAHPPPQKRPITRVPMMPAPTPTSSSAPVPKTNAQERRTSSRQASTSKPPRLFSSGKDMDDNEKADLMKNYREYISTGHRPSEFMSKEEEFRLQDIAKNHIPRTLREAMDAIEIIKMQKKTMVAALRTLNIMVAELRLVYCREILATKLVQRQLCISTVLDCIDDFDIKNSSLANEHHHRLRRLPETFARGPDKKRKTEQRIFWDGGDVPLYDEKGNVVPGMPPLDEVIARMENMKSSPEAAEAVQNEPAPEGPEVIVEQTLPPAEFGNVAAEETQDDNSEASDDTPPFGDGEYCRLLHVLADKRVGPHLNELRNPELKEKPWSLYVAPIFNDKKFRPVPIKSVSGGVKRSHIIGIYPRFICERDGETLQQKFAEFKSLYRAAVRGYLQFGDDDSRTFVDFSQSKRYIMYAFCLLEKVPHLEPLTLRLEETRTKERARTENTLKRPVTLVDLEGEDDLADIASTPVAKRAKAAMLGDKERDELTKIIEGGVPEDLENTGGQPGINLPMTKSEEIQWREREEKDRPVYDAIAQTGGMGSEGLLWCLLRSTPGSAKFIDIEDRLREKIVTELRHAQDRHLISLLSGLREARTLLADSRDPQEAALVASAKSVMLSNLRSNLRQRQKR